MAPFEILLLILLVVLIAAILFGFHRLTKATYNRLQFQYKVEELRRKLLVAETRLEEKNKVALREKLNG